jgi:hypothetical protein
LAADTDMARPAHLLAIGLAVFLCLGREHGNANAAPAKSRRPSVTAAKVREAERLVNQAAELYQQNRYSEAIPLFERAYTLDPHPIILLNIGRAHNRNGALDQALHFYRLYLQRSPDATDRPQIEERVQQLEQALGLAPATFPDGETPPPLDEPPPIIGSTSAPPPAIPPVAVPPPREHPATTTPTVPRAPLHRPSDALDASTAAQVPRVIENPFRIQIAPGVAVPQFAKKKTQTSTARIEPRPIFALSIAAVYAAPISFGFVDIALVGQWSPVRYETTTDGLGVLSHLGGAFISTALRAAVSESLFIGPSASVGAYWWEGLKPGNPFTRNGQGTPAIPMPTLRFGLPVIGDLGNHLLLGVEPSYSVSKTTGDALSSAIDAIHRFELSGVFAVVF